MFIDANSALVFNNLPLLDNENHASIVCYMDYLHQYIMINIYNIHFAYS